MDQPLPAGGPLASRPRDRRLPAGLAIALIGIYRRWLSPALPPLCRFHPTCSAYAQEAVERHGLVRGLGMAILRLLRCHPLHPGGYDPVR